jgi:hypothetical protein
MVQSRIELRIRAAGEDEMTRAVILMALTLAVSGHGAVAFQEQGGRAPAQAAPTAGIVAPANQLPKTGTEIRIPGLGQIGSLPKFDFGLELLYGASEPKGIREELNKSDPNDLQVRGILKFKLPN